MIDELRRTLAEHAAEATPAPEPFARLLRRRRRRLRWNAVKAFAAVLVIAMASGWLLARPGHPPIADDIQLTSPTPQVTALLRSPTRGSLADDRAFLREMRVKAADEADQDEPSDPDHIAALFAGDLPSGERLVLLAAVTGNHGWLIEYLGPSGAAIRRMVREDAQRELMPVVTVEQRVFDRDSGRENPGGFVLMLGPVDAQLTFSDDPHMQGDGTVRREWRTEDAAYLFRKTEDIRHFSRARFTLGGTVLYEASLRPILSSQTVTINPTPLRGIGTTLPEAAQDTADTIARTTGFSSTYATYQVLWSDEIPMPGLENATTAEIATVFARTPDGGGVYATFAFDAQGNARNHPTGSGILGDPDRSLIAMRLPWFAEQNTLLQVIAPPTATVAKLTHDNVVVGSTNLVGGVGNVQLPSPAKVTVTAYDAAGTAVAKRDFADWEENMTDMYEPEVRGW